MTPRGLATRTGEYGLDVIVFAIGFDQRDRDRAHAVALRNEVALDLHVLCNLGVRAVVARKKCLEDLLALV